MHIKALLIFILFIAITAMQKLVAQINPADSLALIDFYDSTNGTNWSGFNDNWKTMAPVSSWQGVSVSNNRVTGLYMVGNHSVSGIIPSSFSNLDSMKSINFIDNGFRGNLLLYMANFKGMTVMHIGEQYLTGSIPSSLGYLAKLTEMTIYGPNFSGPLPVSLGNLTNLKKLDVGYSNHSGNIPGEELSNLNLNYFSLAGNHYTFREIEPLVQIFKAKSKEAALDYGSQANIPTIQLYDRLLVMAGGVAGHNTYNWYKTGTGLLATIIGDSTYRPATPGTYYATVTSSVATQLMLTSNPLKAAAVAVPLCAGAASFTITSDVSGAAYQWQASEDSVNFYNISDDVNYSGSNTLTLHLLNVPSSWYGRKYRCLADAATSTIFTIYFSNTWVDTGVANWENAANWSCGSLPDANTDVVINSGIIVVNSNVVVRSLTLADGVMFTVTSGHTLTVRH